MLRSVKSRRMLIDLRQGRVIEFRSSVGGMRTKHTVRARRVEKNATCSGGDSVVTSGW